jgi:hypothetical protein
MSLLEQLKQELKEIEGGCGKEFVEEETDCTCGEDFPDDDGTPFAILCEICQAKANIIKKHIELVKRAIENMNYAFSDGHFEITKILGDEK